MQQIELFDQSEQDRKFFEYHRENPHVFALITRYANDVKQAGYKHYGMHTIMHRIRWHINIDSKDRAGFKMNNNYSSRYARLLIQENPEFDGFFRNRRLKTQSVLGD